LARCTTSIPEHGSKLVVMWRVWIAFDCRGPGAKNRLHRERQAWGAAATVENLGYGHVVLVVRPGGGRKLKACNQ